MPGPLAHLTVLDLSRVLAGPWCTQLLADLGATVIKIERPGTGDDTRAWGPPYLKDADGRDTSESAYYLACNRGKRSVAVDFTKPEGREIVVALAHRDRTGEGQWIDACLFDSAVAMMATLNLNYLVTGVAPTRAGNAHQNIVPYQTFAVADGYMILAVGNDGQFAKFCDVAGRPEW